MTAKTHIAAGILTGITFAAVNHFGFDKTVTCCVISAAAALSPDIDLLTSKAGKALKPIAFIINKFFGHRTICHAPLTFAIVYFVLRLFFYPYLLYINMAYVGIISHLFMDMMNSTGIPLFWPIKKRFHLASIKTNGAFEIFVHGALLCGIAYVAYCMFRGIDVFPQNITLFLTNINK